MAYEEEAEDNEFEALVNAVSEEYDADVLVYAGPIGRPYDDLFISRCKRLSRTRRNVLLLLNTFGGDPHAAYRIARHIQFRYGTSGKDLNRSMKANTVGSQGHFFLFVDTVCKSAGTILAMGASTLILSDYAELGPIDVQLRKSDEVGERTSGLTPMQALDTLGTLAREFFKRSFTSLRFDEELAFTTKLSAEISTGMVTGLFQPIYAQIDPMRIGEIDRALRIADEYGKRLGQSNLKDGALERLVAEYPSHGFVIDRKEACELFKRVEAPKSRLEELGELLRPWVEGRMFENDRPSVMFLTQEAHEGDQESDLEDEKNDNELQDSTNPREKGTAERAANSEGRERHKPDTPNGLAKGSSGAS